MLKYKIKVKDQNGDYLGEFNQFKGLKFGKRLNNYGQSVFSIPVISPKLSSLIYLRRYTVEIIRNDTLVWAGEQAHRRGELKANKNNWATITNFDWLEQLNQRKTLATRTFTGVDAGLIGWTTIDETQNDTDGDLGITQGTIETTQDRDREFHNDNLMDIQINLSNVLNGFDFEITNEKVYNVYVTKGDVLTDSVIFKYGSNMNQCTIDEDFINPVNRAIVLGEQSGGASDLSRIERENATSMSLYKLREATITASNVSESETFDEKGDSLLRKNALPLFKIDINIIQKLTPNISQFGVGDVITLIVKEGIYDINRAFRIFGWDVELGNNNQEKLSLILGDFTLL